MQDTECTDLSAFGVLFYHLIIKVPVITGLCFL